jgi:hypothetical protein
MHVTIGPHIEDISYHIMISYRTLYIVYRPHSITWVRFHTPHLRYVSNTANVVLLTNKLLRRMHQTIETRHDAKRC